MDYSTIHKTCQYVFKKFCVIFISTPKKSEVEENYAKDFFVKKSSALPKNFKKEKQIRV